MRLKEYPIGDYVDKCQTWNPKSSGVGSFDYIDLSSVDKNAKSIVSIERYECSDAPSRARQLVETDDVLVATVRPNLNGVALVNGAHHGMTASTGYCVLRPDKDKLDSRFLFHWVKTGVFVQRMVDVAIGANYPAVSDAKVKASKIPLPPFAEQKRIAGILDAADALRAKRREAIAQLDTLLKATFLDMFGDPVRGDWPMAKVEDVASNEKGAMRTGPFGSQLLHSEFVDKGIRVLGIDNAVADEFREGEPRFITPKKYEQLRRYTVRPGDILITIMGTCGRCAIVPDNIGVAINTKHLCCITLDRDKCLPRFLHAYFLQHPIARRYLERSAKGAIMSGLNMGIIRALPIPVPPLELQYRFAAIVKSVEQQIASQRAHLNELDTLFASLQSRAFR